MSCQPKLGRITPCTPKKQAASRSLLAVARCAPHVNCERMRRPDLAVGGEALFRGSQGRAEIAQFVVDLRNFPYGLGDFFAKQTALTTTQPVDKIFHCRFLKGEYPGKCSVRYILPLRSEATTQNIKDAPSSAFFTLVAQ